MNLLGGGSGMFDEEKIKTLNELEMAVYKYIVQHFEEIDQLTIRELSAACHVSTSTILRCITKLGYRGYSELKYAICQKKEQDARAFDLFYDATIQVNTFLKKVNNEDYRKFIQPAVELILSARHVAFSGIGTSGILGTYGSRYFANLGINAYSIVDPFLPVPPRGMENTLAIILSVSGETIQMIKQTEDFKRYGAKVLSITNDEKSTIAQMADYNISYYMPVVSGGKEVDLNLTTQVPVITLIELLAHQVYKQI
ncbi:MurR/RpiR family transcriptional regulator [Enterococcus sp. PF-2]|jgi:DNA-binding MurR/RpiR family transcriptional regulator|nr:MurR/RpiR family transcriptional regulator [Enterococcus gallinarum]EPH59211.1 SIS domain protein [Enterococcus faecium 13.SD.W.09]TPE01511.1 MurR/RpiR family transcriptional regulator [Enterococcus sp. PF-3]TPE24966.1 MurR/RpiR family transcriptional regulator [Enterococcus sp. PF-2]TPR57373.1 MurR/RpiR family transcriptional regulator [Enterococcus sp. OL5]